MRKNGGKTGIALSSLTRVGFVPTCACICESSRWEFDYPPKAKEESFKRTSQTH